MTNLTDKWKKGELPDGFYWIEFQDGEITSTTFSKQHGFICCDSLCDDEHIKQILAAMPSYEQWQAKLEENAQLKEMLNEVKEIFGGNTRGRIDEILGEE